MVNLPWTHPAGVRICFGERHTSHLSPLTPGLQTHLPVICSQSSRTEPNNEHPQAEARKK